MFCLQQRFINTYIFVKSMYLLGKKQLPGVIICWEIMTRQLLFNWN